MGIGSELWLMRLKFPFTCGHVTPWVISPTERGGVLYTCLGVKPVGPGWVPDPRRPISDAPDGDRTRQVQPEVNRIKLCDGASE